MTVEQLRNVHRALPFRPFTIHMGDGRAFLVRHPDFLSHSPTGRTVIVHPDDESFHVLDLLLVTELEVHAPTRPAGEAAFARLVAASGRCGASVRYKASVGALVMLSMGVVLVGGAVWRRGSAQKFKDRIRGEEAEGGQRESLVEVILLGGKVKAEVF